MTQPYNIWNKWDKLKTVMLGDCYSAEFFKDIKSDRIRSALTRIADETSEDLEYFYTVLKDFGCEIIRPELDRSDNIMNYITDDGKVNRIPRSPLQPRDGQLVAGNTLVYTWDDHPTIKKALDKYSTEKDTRLLLTDPIKYHPLLPRHIFDAAAGSDLLTYKDYCRPDYFDRVPDYVKQELIDLNFTKYFAEAPSMTVIGQDIYVDYRSPRISKYDNLIGEVFGDRFRINKLGIGGHNDATFHTIKPGAILTLKGIQKYEQTFPGWDLCILPDQSWYKVQGFLRAKEKVKGKWWVPGQEENDEFIEFVETWLQDWVGYVEETVFDVNVLVLDEHHVCINNMNPQVIEFLKKHNMEPVHIPWRHRYFWDGGLHCITLDLFREGGQQDYFPDRLAPIVDVGFR